MLISQNWTEFEVIDAGKGEKLERWGDKLLLRPDPQAIWDVDGSDAAWGRVDAHYHRSDTGGGSWQYLKKLPDYWNIGYNDLRFKIGTMSFKHTGLFPEQAVNWDWMRGLIESCGERVSVLNLFAYTGGATMACAKAGAEVCHVDSSKGMVNWAKDNAALCGLREAPIRYIIDDCAKFVKREQRRGRKYKAVIMDPPSYGRGPSGEMWKIEDMLYDFLLDCIEVLDDEPLFFLINSYTTGLQPQVLRNLLQVTAEKKFGGRITADEVGLPIKSSGLILPCGASGRWQRA